MDIAGGDNIIVGIDYNIDSSCKEEITLNWWQTVSMTWDDLFLLLAVSQSVSMVVLLKWALYLSYSNYRVTSHSSHNEVPWIIDELSPVDQLSFHQSGFILQDWQ